MSKYQQVVVAHDLHYPRYSKPTWAAMIHLIEKVKPSKFVFGGDQFDNAEISHHNKGKSYYKPRRAYLTNQENFEAEILEVLDAALPEDCEKVWIVGNHDDWEFQFVEEHPELEGVVDRVSALGLEKAGWKVVPLGHSYTVGRLNIIHGEILTGVGNQAGIYPSRKAMELYADNVLAGHTHSPQSFTKVSPVDHKKKHMAWIAPILGATNPDYLRNRPTAWLNGFTLVEVWGRGNFNVYPIVVTDGSCSYGGVVYG